MEPELLDKLLTKVGSKFKLVSLYQKRMRELVRGLPPLTETDTMDPWDIAAKEILNNKVDLIIGEEAERIRRDIAAREAEEGNHDKKKEMPARSEDKKG
ncbi:MAG: DNA-directed RNA polymerase subunit omega [Planctomycetes bacterium]|nr:DNA-directed RNA polymerase subunit omega [Planctomycetota bacterium]